MKDKLQLSYKLSSTRTMTMKPMRTAILQKLFLLELSPVIKQSTLFVNLDETHFSRSTYSRYSWIPKGLRYAHPNSNITGSLSLLVAITSGGHYLASPALTAVNSKVFNLYF